MNNHECNFCEEEEPSGRLILAPCLECGKSGAEALKLLDKQKQALVGAVKDCITICIAHQFKGAYWNNEVRKLQKILESIK
jgi:hypothetical protein